MITNNGVHDVRRIIDAFHQWRIEKYQFGMSDQAEIVAEDGTSSYSIEYTLSLLTNLLKSKSKTVPSWYRGETNPQSNSYKDLIRILKAEGYSYYDLTVLPRAGSARLLLDRKKVLRSIFKILESDKYKRLHLYGTSGCGKTTIAELFHRYTSEYYKKRIYINCKDLDFEDALASALEVYSPGKLNTRSSLQQYIDTQKAEPSLLIIDNYESGDKYINQFLPDIVDDLFAHWSVLILSRRWYDTDQAVSMSLPQINSEKEVFDLFIAGMPSFLSDNEVTKSQIIRFADNIGYHPLLMNIYAGVIEEKYKLYGVNLFTELLNESVTGALPSLSESSFLDNREYDDIVKHVIHLTEVSDQKDKMEFCLDFLILFFFSNNDFISRKTLVSLFRESPSSSGLPADFIKNITFLISSGFIQFDDSQNVDGYSCHKIIQSAIEKYYFPIRKEVYTRIRPILERAVDSVAKRIGYKEDEILNILEGCLTFFGIDFFDDTLGLKIILNSRRAFGSFIHYSYLEKKYLKGIELAEKFNEIETYIALHYELAAVYANGNQIDKSLTIKTIGYKAAQSFYFEDCYELASYLSRYAYSIARVKGHRAGIGYKEKACSMIEKLNRSNSESEPFANSVSMNIWDNLSGSYGAMGSFSEAEKYKKLALETAIQLKDSFAIARYSNNLGHHYIDTGRLSDAEEHLNYAEKLYKKMNRTADRFYLMVIKGQALQLIRSGKFERAEQKIHEIERVQQIIEFDEKIHQEGSFLLQIKGEWLLLQALESKDGCDIQKARSYFEKRKDLMNQNSIKYFIQSGWIALCDLVFDGRFSIEDDSYAQADIQFCNYFYGPVYEWALFSYLYVLKLIAQGNKFRAEEIFEKRVKSFLEDSVLSKGEFLLTERFMSVDFS